MPFILGLLFCFFGFAEPNTTVVNKDTKISETQDIGIQEQLGQQLDLSLLVKDETGQALPLSHFVNGKKPVLLSLVYFSCPGLCNFHLNGLTDALKKLEWSAGEKFEVLALSFDPNEGPDVAIKKKENYMKLYARAGAAEGWHFLTAEADVIQKITGTVGFKYKWNETEKEWAHASAVIFLTPSGKISRYLNGVFFEPQDLKFAMIEAADGKIATIHEQIISYCYQYDPKASQYKIVASHVVKLGGGVIVLLIALFLGISQMRTRFLNAKKVKLDV